MAEHRRPIEGIRLLAYDGSMGFSARLVALSPGEDHADGRSAHLSDRHRDALRALMAEILTAQIASESQAGGERDDAY